jgi:hypothetical protein
MDPDTLNHWRRTIKKILTDLAAIPFPEVVNMTAKTVFDETTDAYLVVVEGWQDVRRLHGCLAHVEIKGDKIWIQQDGTEDGVAGDLLAAGIPKDHVVLGFKSPQSWALTGFAVAWRCWAFGFRRLIPPPESGS